MRLTAHWLIYLIFEETLLGEALLEAQRRQGQPGAADKMVPELRLSPGPLALPSGLVRDRDVIPSSALPPPHPFWVQESSRAPQATEVWD